MLHELRIRIQNMSGHKKSLADGISAMASVGALFAGEVAGVEVNTIPAVR